MIRNTNQAHPPDMKGGLGDLAADLISLSELQIELLAVDSRDALRESVYPGILICLGGGLIIGACPVLLFGLAWGMAELTGLSLAFSCCLSAVFSLGAAGLCLYLARKGLRKSLGYFNRSREELQSNTQWIKHILSEKQRYHQTAER